MTHYNKNFSNKKEGSCNHAEHKQWNRRSFLQALGLVGGGALTFANTPLSASKPSPLASAIGRAESDRVVIIVELKGGNDGLNTIIPIYDYDTYANARPDIKIQQSNLISLNSDFGIPNYATKFEEMWGEGQMKIVHGVGYQNGSLSHFKGQDNWASANPINTQQSTGWMGRYFEDIYPDYLFDPPLKPAAIQIGNVGNLTFNGEEAYYGFNVSSPEKLFQIAQNGSLYDINNLPPCLHGEQKGYLRSIANSTFNYAGVINEAFTASTDYGDYPDNKLAKQLSVISRMIKGNLETKVYLVQLGGFDTHNAQASRHEQLITQLSESLSHFYKDMAAAGWDDKVLCMTTSEFGRRVAQNGSAGTDHGSASQTMFFGSALNGSGFVGTHPDLSDLDTRGNLKFTKDFRELYASVLKDWLCVNPDLVNEVLLGQEYDSLNLGFECSTLSDDEVSFDGNNKLKHYVKYDNDQPYLHIKMPNTGHVDVKLFNILGQELATLKNEILFAGEHIINVNKAAGNQLMAGQYIYRIVTSNKSYSKSLVIS